MFDKLESLYSLNIIGMKKSTIRELLKLTQKPEIISFAGGLPAPQTFPVETIANLTREMILKDGLWALQYGPTEGDPRLRDEIIKIMEKDNVHAARENILMISGSQQGLDMIGRVFLNPHNPVIVSMPTYVGALSAFNGYSARFEGVESDEQGLRTDLLREKLQDLQLQADLPKFIYVVPDFQNPMGVTMALDRRKELLKLAQKYQVMVIEDSPYRQIRFVGEHIPSLYELDEDRGYVISLRTFSKILFPGLRLGWIVASKEVNEKFIIAKQAMDLCAPPFCQATAYEFCHRGLLDEHIKQIVELYKGKCETMLQAMETYMPKHPELQWTKPEGGLFLWVTLPPAMNAEDLFHESIKENVAYVNGSAFYHDGSGKNALRLNFSFSSKEDITEGIKRLSKVIQKNLPKS